MKEKSTCKKKTVAFTAAERAALLRAKDAHRTGLPVCAKTRRHLAAAHRKVNLQRYGQVKVFTQAPPAAADQGAANFH